MPAPWLGGTVKRRLLGVGAKGRPQAADKAPRGSHSEGGKLVALRSVGRRRALPGGIQLGLPFGARRNEAPGRRRRPASSNALTRTEGYPLRPTASPAAAVPQSSPAAASMATTTTATPSTPTGGTGREKGADVPHRPSLPAPLRKAPGALSPGDPTHFIDIRAAVR